MHQVQFSVLGPVRIAASDRVVPLRGPLRRGLLALLLVHAGRLVTRAEIVEALWGGAPPPTATAQVRAGVSVIRQALRDAGGAAGTGLLASSSGGYLLTPDSGMLDLDQFLDDLGRARRALAGRRLEPAYDLLRAALERWHGEALADAAGAHVPGTRTRLEEQRLAAEEELIEAGLALGRQAELVPRLVDLVAAHPLRQRPRGQLMVALYRCGRAPEALATYRDLRQRLGEEQGLAPSREIEQLHLACLRGDATLEAPAAPGTGSPPGRPSAPTGPTGWAPPAQLPRDVGDFTGRAAVLDRLCDLLGDAAGRGPAVLSILGKPAVGKTALALRAAHRLRPRFPDGQLYASLGGGNSGTGGSPGSAGGGGGDGASRGQPADPAEVLAAFLRALGVPGSAVPAPLDQRAALYRSLLAERRVLVVLDDAADEAQVRPLLPGQPPSAVVLTGRRSLTGLEDVTVVHLGLLLPEETRELLGRIAGDDRLAAEPTAAATIGQQCGHLPLAVRICGARLAARPEAPLADLARVLADERRRLAELAAGDLDVRSSFAVSYRALPEPRRRAFRLLGLLPAADPAAWVVAALLGTQEREAEDVLRRLVDDQLLDVVGRDAAGQVRYRLHDLLRLYAGERLAAEEPPDARAAALRRAVEAAAAAVARQVGKLPAGGGATWLAAERTVLVGLLEYAFRDGWADLGWRLGAALEGFFELGAHFDDWQRSQRLALAAAVAAGDRRQEALARRRLAAALWLVDRWSEAQDQVERCLPVFRELDDLLEEARALRTLGRVQHEQGRWDEAVASLSASSEILTRLGDRRELACTLRDLGMRHRFRADTPAALDCLQRSMDEYETVGDLAEAASTRIQLGCARRDLGDLKGAEDLLRQSLEDLEAVGDPSGQAQALFQLAVTLRRQGRHGAAAGCLRISLDSARRLGHRLGEGMIELNLAEIHTDQAHLAAARRCAERSLAIFQELQSPYWQGRAHAALGRLLALTGRPAAANESWQRALALLQPLGAPEAAGIAALVRPAPPDASGPPA
jgi:DNA-binding SARP family transcriptional activator